MGELRLTLLGRPHVTCDDIPLSGWALQKSLALLAYLAVTGRPHSRGALAGLLWTDCSEANARSNLRKVVSELRQRVPSHLTITRADVAFDRASAYWLDVKAFERQTDRALALRARRVTRASAAALAEAVELYRDEFMLGLAVHKAAAFEEWLLLQRVYLRNLALRALHALVGYHAAQAHPARTLTYLERMLALEPAHEEAHRKKILLLAQGGDRATALRQYEACCQALQALDTEPDSETTALYDRIRGGAELRQHFRVPARSVESCLTPLSGRRAELAEIQARLRDPSCRLLTVVGPGGVGKTHLALEAAASVSPGRSPDSFEDGVFVVHLDSVPEVGAIVPAIAQVLDLPLSEGARPWQQVVDHLCGKQLLLVIDGFEHLAAGAGLLVDLLRAAPGLTMLVTSRAPLDVHVEHLFPLAGLACPDRAPEDPELLPSMPAIQLYLSAALRIRPGFDASAADLLDIGCICRLVDGLPLAILLAASWSGMLAPGEIASELEGKSGLGLGILQTGSRDLPARQRSMRAVFDHSWDLLATRERQMLAGLSVFRGSFTLEAARQVAGASLGALRSLMDGSLLQRLASGRYAIHELLREYAGERLAEAPEGAHAARDRHSAYYTEAVEQWWADLQGPGHQSALAEMGAENGNLRAAWEWAVERGLVAHLDRAMEGLCYFYKWLGRYEEGESLCRRAVEGLASIVAAGRGDRSDPAGGAQAYEWRAGVRVRARALGWQGVFCHRLGGREDAWELLQRSRQWLDDLACAGLEAEQGLPEDIQRGRAFVLWRLGNLATELDEVAAQRFYRQSLALYRELDDPWGTGSVLEASGRAATFADEGEEAQHAYEESLELRQAQGDDLGSYRVLSLSLATTAYESGAGDEPGAAPVTMPPALHAVGLAIGAGQFSRAESLLAGLLGGYEGRGAGGRADLVELVRAFNQMHLGHYERARARMEACLARFRNTGYRLGMERCCCYLALAALAVGAYAEAEQRLQESVGLCREGRQRGHLGQALALLALVARGAGDHSRARQHLREALRTAVPVHDYETFMFQVLVVLAMALILADEGEGGRAVELYAMASRYPLVANSQLVEDLAGQHIAAIENQLPLDAAVAARDRGGARGLEAVMADLLAELGA